MNRQLGCTLAATLAAALLTQTEALAQPSYTPAFEIGGTEVRGFYESTPTGRTDDLGTPYTDRFGHLESSSAVGLSFSLGGGSRSIVPPELRDPAFEPYVDIATVGEALCGRDASSLTDVALQLAHGERTLCRPHQSGISSATLFAKALKLTANARDEETLARIAKAAEGQNLPDILSQAEATQKLLQASRGVDETVKVSLESTDIDSLALLKSLHDEIEVAEALGEAERLESLASEIQGVETLTEDQKSQLVAMAKSAREGLGDVEDSPESLAIRKLAETSRSHWLTRPGDWGKKGVILFPTVEPSVSTLPVEPDYGPRRLERYRASGGSRFEATGQGQWIERTPEGPINRFEERGRTNDMVEIRDAQRQLTVRLTPGQALWWDASARKWHMFDSGNWQ